MMPTSVAFSFLFFPIVGCLVVVCMLVPFAGAQVATPALQRFSRLNMNNFTFLAVTAAHHQPNHWVSVPLCKYNHCCISVPKSPFCHVCTSVSVNDCCAV